MHIYRASPSLFTAHSFVSQTPLFTSVLGASSPAQLSSHLQTEPSEIHRLVDWDCVSNTLSGVPNQLRSIAIHELRVSRLRVVGDVLGEGDVHHVGPLLHGLSEIGVRECAVCCSVPAV